MASYRVTFLPEGKEVEVEEGRTLFEAADKAGVYLNTLCGAKGVCGKCRVQVVKGQARADRDSLAFFSREELQSGYVLACMTPVREDMEVLVPPESRVEGEQILMDTRSRQQAAFGEAPLLAYGEPGQISLHRRRVDPASLFAPLVNKVYLELPPPTTDDNLPDTGRLVRELRRKLNFPSYDIPFACLRDLSATLRSSDWKVTVTLARRDSMGRVLRIEPGNTSDRNYGIAVDVGTTTVVTQLVDLRTGNVLGVEGSHNLQARHGEDVLSRIAFACGKGSLEILQKAVTGNINTLIETVTRRKGLAPTDVSGIVAAGNTTMTHILLGLAPCTIREDPYVPTVDLYPQVWAAQAGINVHPQAILQVLPNISSYVGGDIVAGILACGMADKPELACLIDVGTNGEIVIGNNEWMLSCSASAGPAFEGAGTRSGMRAARGAIQKVQIEDGKVTYDTIGKARPRGICGSGFVDVLYELARHRIIDIDGRFRRNSAEPRLRSSQGIMEYIVALPEETETGEAMVVSQSDLDNIIRSKGAVFAAIKSLVDYAGLTFQDLQRLYIAGGFGNFLDIEKAISIGLLPDVARERIEFIGNSSLMGARMALVSSYAYEKAVSISGAVTNVELSRYAPFGDEYLAALYLPHIDRQLLFPSVTY